jgi:hypothetical protein
MNAASALIRRRYPLASHGFRGFVLMIAVALCSATYLMGATVSPQDGTLLKVYFALSKGKLTVDTTNTAFVPGYTGTDTSLFPASSYLAAYTAATGRKLTAAQAAQIKSQLCSQIQDSLANLPPFYYFAFGKKGVAPVQDKSDSEVDALDGPLMSSQVQTAFRDWAAGRHPPVSGAVNSILVNALQYYLSPPRATGTTASQETAPDTQKMAVALDKDKSPIGYRFFNVANPVSPSSYDVLYSVTDKVPADSLTVFYQFVGNRPIDQETDAVRDKVNRVKREVEAAIAPEKGKLWIPADIKRCIDVYYATEGVLATSQVTDFNGDSPVPTNSLAPHRRTILIAKPGLGTIVLPMPASSGTTAEAKGTGTKQPLPAKQTTDNGLPAGMQKKVLQVLYNLLPDQTFRQYVEQSGSNYYRPATTTGPAPQPPIVDVGLFTSGTAALDQIDLLKFRAQQSELQKLNFEVSYAQAAPFLERCTYYVKDDGTSVSSTNTQTTGTNGSQSNGKTEAAEKGNSAGQSLSKQPTRVIPVPRTLASTTAGNETVASSESLSAGMLPTWIDSPLESATNKKISKSTPVTTGSGALKDNYVGIGLSYRPNQGLRTLAICDLPNFAGGALDLQVGSDSTNPIGKASYSQDYALFGDGQLLRRLTLSVNGATDTESDRILSGTKTDVTRNTGGLEGDLEVFRDLDDQYLRLTAQSNYENVSLSKGTSTVSGGRFEISDLSAFYQWTEPASPYAKRLSITPKVELGEGLSGQSADYAVFSLGANFHSNLPDYWQFDLSALYERATAGTPLFELPSLGGQDSVRGFRQDEALGDQLWATQTELWFPLPGTGGTTDTGAFMAEHLRGASFFDAGDVEKPVGSNSGFRCSPGLGLRLIFNSVIVKFDYAYGFGRKDHGGKDGEVYITVSYAYPM